MTRCTLITLFVLLCGITSASAHYYQPTASGRQEKSGTTALTADQCFFYAIDGKVTVCHRTQSAVNPYVLLRVSAAACVNGHASHDADFVSTHGQDCAD